MSGSSTSRPLHTSVVTVRSFRPTRWMSSVTGMWKAHLPSKASFMTMQVVTTLEPTVLSPRHITQGNGGAVGCGGSTHFPPSSSALLFQSSLGIPHRLPAVPYWSLYSCHTRIISAWLIRWVTKDLLALRHHFYSREVAGWRPIRCQRSRGAPR